MRVLQILHGREAGGVLTLAETVRDGLTAPARRVDIAYLFPDTGARLLAKIMGTIRVAWRILTERPDAVIGYQASASILCGTIGWIAGCRHRIVHQTALPRETKWLMRRLDRLVGSLGLYTVNVVNSAATLAAFTAYPAAYRRSMILVEHGVPPPQPTRSRAATLRAFGFAEDALILVNVGRLTPQKNQCVLIEALTQLEQVHLVVAGDGPLRHHCETMAARLGVADRLHLLGDVSRDDVADLLAAADLFVFPSTWETFGLAAIEAAIAGVPIVAADLPVLREVLWADGSAAAWFVAPSDVDGWARAIKSHLGHAAVGDRRTSAAAIARRYAVAPMIDAYAAILR